MDMRKKVEILSRITTRDEAGVHYTQRYSRNSLDELEDLGLIKQTKPRHDNGMWYSEECWFVDLTEDGKDLVDCNVAYWDVDAIAGELEE